MTDLPERARKLAKQFITEQNETYSPATREEEEAELSKLAALILAELQAERARTTERIVSFYLIGKSGPAYLYANELRAAGMDKPNEERKYADAK
jgi:hypothetical protein